MKKFLSYTFGSLFMGSILVTGLYALTSTAQAGWFWSDDDDEEGGSRSNGATNNPALAKLYKEECGSCHLAYPVKMLPANSWHKLIGGLGDHFGENAELDNQTRSQLLTYLGIADTKDNHNARSNNAKDVPVRITKSSWFRRKHHELPSNVLNLSPKLTSMSQCNACHRGAERGDFDEDNVSIPGLRSWD